MKPSQEKALDRLVVLRADIDEARKRVDIGVYKTLRLKNVPAVVIAERLGLTRQRVYQMARSGRELLDG